MAPITENPLCGNQSFIGKDPAIDDVETCPIDCALRTFCDGEQNNTGVTPRQVQADLRSKEKTKQIRGRYRLARFTQHVGQAVSTNRGIPFPGAQSFIDTACNRTKPTS